MTNNFLLLWLSGIGINPPSVVGPRILETRVNTATKISRKETNGIRNEEPSFLRYYSISFDK